MLHSVILMCRCKIIFMYDVLSWTTQCHIPEHHNLTTDSTLPFNVNPFWSKYFLIASVSDTCNLYSFVRTNQALQLYKSAGKCMHGCAYVCVNYHCFLLFISLFLKFYVSTHTSWPLPHYIKFNAKHYYLLMRCIKC